MLILFSIPMLILSTSVDAFSEKIVRSKLPEVPGRYCDRVCDRELRYHCVFNFRFETHQNNLNCSTDQSSKCFGDGNPREVTLIADVDEQVLSVPANSIVVCHGDEVTVNVANGLETDACTIHWHGLPMRPYSDSNRMSQEDSTQYSDGVPFVTQCPILPGQEFKWYNFNAEPSGTFWFHSHNPFQRDDGAYGTLVIRDHPDERMELPGDLQELLMESCDMTEHSIILQEWYFNTGEYRFYNDKSERPTSILVNGQGRNLDQTTAGYRNRYNPAINHTRNLDLEGAAVEIPWPIFTVHPHECSRYRFRIVSAVNLHCPIQFSIEDHLMTVISSDGAYIHPEKDISSLTLSNGERYDILVDVRHHEKKTYQMRFGGAPGEFAECMGISTIGFLQYDSSEIDQSIIPDYSAAINVPGRHVNPLPSITLPEDQTAVSVSSLRSINPLDNKEKADKTFYLQLGDNEGGANLNAMQFDLETLGSPLLSQDFDLDPKMFCDTSYTREGTLCNPETDENGCKCFHVLHVDIGDVVELFFINPAEDKPIAHPMHLHGYYFNVIASGPIPESNPMEYVKVLNEIGEINRNLHHPPQKDSLQTRPGEYMLVRFIADNPGYWTMHCHISYDVIEGQALVINVGNSNDWAIPQDFPKCG